MLMMRRDPSKHGRYEIATAGVRQGPVRLVPR
jgi:hypothetical protein